jgi:hypothetical protein
VTWPLKVARSLPANGRSPYSATDAGTPNANW